MIHFKGTLHIPLILCAFKGFHFWHKSVNILEQPFPKMLLQVQKETATPVLDFLHYLPLQFINLVLIFRALRIVSHWDETVGDVLVPQTARNRQTLRCSFNNLSFVTK